MRAYSLITVKGIEEERRVLSGLATTPTVDRVQDVVEPMGMQQRGPVGLYLYHKHDLPVGQVKFGKATKQGIPFTAEIPDVVEEGTVRDRVNEAWHSIKYGLLRAVSIGFVPIADAYEVMKNGGIRYKEWEMLELSLVGVPANPEALITSFKSCDPNGIRTNLGLELSDGSERKALIDAALRGAVPLSKATKQNLNGAVRLNRS